MSHQEEPDNVQLDPEPVYDLLRDMVDFWTTIEVAARSMRQALMRFEACSHSGDRSAATTSEDRAPST